jgi:hypothetical protein
MQRAARNYDEDSLLTDYVWAHCRTYMTDFERKSGNAVVIRRQAAMTQSEQMRRTILERWGGFDNPDVVAALSEGEEAFRIAVRDRLLREHPEIVTRCPKCHRVVRTPHARQCRWCFHDWH